MAVCQHCGKALPLRDLFSGSNPFCSSEHKQLYQDEYGRLALGRLQKENGNGEPRPTAVLVAEPPAVAVALRRGGRPPVPAPEWLGPPVPAPKPEPEPAVVLASQEERQIEAPAFRAGERRPMAARMVLLVLAIVIAGILAFRFTRTGQGQPAAPAGALARAVPLGPGGWFNQDTTDRSGAFSIYRPTLELADCRIEFTGRIEQASLAWVARWTGPDNYQGMKLTRQDGRVLFSRWAVLDGKQGPREEAVVAARGSLQGHSVKMELQGPRFTVYVEGQPAASWTEHRLARGGFGFLNQNGERGRIDALQVFLLNR